MWRSLVARVVRDDEAAGSNPVTPTSITAAQSPPSRHSRRWALGVRGPITTLTSPPGSPRGRPLAFTWPACDASEESQLFQFFPRGDGFALTGAYGMVVVTDRSVAVTLADTTTFTLTDVGAYRAP